MPPPMGGQRSAGLSPKEEEDGIVDCCTDGTIPSRTTSGCQWRTCWRRRSTSGGWRQIMVSWSSGCSRVFLLGREGMAVCVWGERCIVRCVEGGEWWVETKRSSPAEAVIINC